ncbi:MAG: IS66 family transposase [Myxococcaceae bacterium]|nr:IS66 family transposase [Myxococcaceae bacterium]
MSEAAASSELMERVAQLETERDEYKHLYVMLLEHVRKLEAGLVGQKSERHVPSSEQLTMDVVSSLVTDAAEEATPAPTTTVERHERARPTGRKPLPEKLPRVVIEVTPPDVQKLGLDAFHRIGEDTCETVEKRPASVVVVRIVRGKFVQKEKLDALEVGEATPVLQAPAVELPIPRGVAGPGLLADTVVKRWEEHQPLHRMERSYGREGYDVHRSTICGWHEMLSKLMGPLIAAMWKDARTNSPYLCTDATGVLVQHAEKCRRGHFFVVVAPEKHVLFNYSAKHDMEAVDELLAGFTGKLVADAHVVYHHLYETGVVECGCWAHARRYFFKALASDATRANHALDIIRKLFSLERQWATAPPDDRLSRRKSEAKPLVDDFFAWCDDEALKVLDETPISKAIQYARNQRGALEQFLADGRLPIDNNISERALRREAVGRKNWLFVGSDDGGTVNATFVSLLASCQMHGIEPYAYLRDLFCLLPSWPQSSVLELAPASWRETSARPEVLAQLDANVHRQVTLGLRLPKSELPKVS